ncbi:hypothetical protein [Nocardioides sp. AE5]|uniref:hypothetical protein n=1 Tax=Nocardioides sp. AE5 TaxID=2962573 RepID=UPI0028813535|nr:hypothetical protein [Nocardioides sp. AE5]MDT0202356.1 hypothetical protein [Nocardioides sp. AE5]
MTRLHLSDNYAVGIDFEVVSEAITNEIAWQFARAHAHGLSSPAAASYLSAIDELEAARSLLRPDSADSIALAHRFVRALRAMHAHDATGTAAS